MTDEKKTEGQNGALPPGFSLHTFPEEYRGSGATHARSAKLPLLLGGGGLLVVGVILVFFLFNTDFLLINNISI